VVVPGGGSGRKVERGGREGEGSCVMPGEGFEREVERGEREERRSHCVLPSPSPPPPPQLLASPLQPLASPPFIVS
jgi:hypothetical protein